MQRTARTVQKVLWPAMGFLLLVGIILVSYSHFAAAINYSAGTYGTCTYDSCSIGLTSSSSVSVNVVPVAGTTKCTVASDTVTATTDASTGYTVSMTDTNTSNTLDGPVSVPASTGTPGSPTTLSANTWGYRVDSIAGFGAGPTSTVSNGAVPSVTFAGVPTSSGTPALIRTTSTADTGTVNTSVWYGFCANTTLQSGAYSDGVTYTALIN